MLYDALLMGKKTPENCPSPWNFVTLAEEDRATAMDIMLRKIVKNRACGSEDILADRQTERHTDRTYSSQHVATAPAGEVIKICRAQTVAESLVRYGFAKT